MPVSYKAKMTLDWNHVLVFAAFGLGHLALMVAVVNRVHARPWPYAVLHPIRIVHDLLIVGVPLAILVVYGIGGPQLLFGGYWTDLPWPVRLYGGLCLLAAGGVPCVAVARALRRVPSAQVAFRTQRLDLQVELQGRVPPGPYAWMLRCPGNEALQLEINERELRLPRVPAAWDGLSILHFSDVHFIGTLPCSFFQRALEAGQRFRPDLIVFTGDLLDRPELIEWIPATFGKLRAPLGCYFILGNHDWLLGDSQPTRQLLQELGWRDLQGRCEVLDVRGHALALAGNEVPWRGAHPEFTGPAEAFRLLLSHTPDHIAWAKRHGVDLMLAGHNHGGQVQLPLYGPVYAPSRYGCRYAAGLFWESPTLLCVNRGLSGRHPLRIRCPPEITKLILRPPVDSFSDRGGDPM